MNDKLAMFGGEMAVTKPIEKYNSIGELEAKYAYDAVMSGLPLSGYLGGRKRGGHYVQRLESLWEEKFGVKHAIAVNSATSGLLAAAFVADLRDGARFLTSPFTMSATAAAPSFFGARPHFIDIDFDDFNMNVDLTAFRMATDPNIKAIVVPNIFGCPARLHELRKIADKRDVLLIEDNAQAILAKERGRYAGTIGHIGVFSLNVHKHIQCGEGGIIVTDDGDLADKMRNFINHGELTGNMLGLNLRLSEVSAAIAIAQLGRVDEIVAGRRQQANMIQILLSKYKDWCISPPRRADIEHSYYVVPFLYQRPEEQWPRRNIMLRALAAEGVPLVSGYVAPLFRLPCFQHDSGQRRGVASKMEDEVLFYFSNCEWTLSDDHYPMIEKAFDKVLSAIQRGELTVEMK